MTSVYLSDEIWKPVPSIPTLQASSLGRIKSTPHKVLMPRGGYVMRGGSATYGQWDGERFIFTHRGFKTCRVARLVCEAFHGLQPIDKPCVLHRDENARNNNPNNLYWGTQKENLNAPGFIAYCRSRTGINNPFLKGRRLR